MLMEQDYDFFEQTAVKCPDGQEYSTLMYNGHVYVPIRYVAENMSANVEYENATQTVTIQQTNVKFDDEVMAPIPTVMFGSDTEEIPTVQGSSCWQVCINTALPDQLLKVHRYKAVGAYPNAKLVVKYPKALEPQNIWISDYKSKQRLTSEVDGSFHLPEEPGVYTLELGSNWNGVGDTLYYFQVEVKDNRELDEAKIREFRRYHIATESELEQIPIRYLGEVDGARVYEVPPVASNVIGSPFYNYNGYVFADKSFSSIIGIKEGRLYTFVALLNIEKVNVKKLYDLMPIELKVKKPQ
ncbi:hypothetical protein GQF04_23810 [Paenibacillus aceris]|uniref:Copper amine oxidase-like N-terminal domain-containing protein n=2 Tax=Paenibacillus aceris TaxID=869555 RepID=A0ABS4I9F6_9BACL|nr:hypothetical protein [Paenibacillus aceris]NHW37543.1 hypothetical protein [Paenibacillus aceris]